VDEINEARRTILQQVTNAFRNEVIGQKYTIAVDQRELLEKGIMAGYSITSSVRAILKLAEAIAASSISKHLARLANDPNALKAFCPACGRHYRFHNKITGECPTNPFDGDDEK
jgi:hypothetical protein